MYALETHTKSDRHATHARAPHARLIALTAATAACRLGQLPNVIDAIVDVQPPGVAAPVPRSISTKWRFCAEPAIGVVPVSVTVPESV